MNIVPKMLCASCLALVDTGSISLDEVDKGGYSLPSAPAYRSKHVPNYTCHRWSLRLIRAERTPSGICDTFADGRRVFLTGSVLRVKRQWRTEKRFSENVQRKQDKNRDESTD